MTAEHERNEQAMDTEKRHYVLLDRDGVINRRMPGGYVTSWEQFEFLPKALDALRLLAENGYTALVISNQACVAKGLLAPTELQAITRRFLLEVALSGGNIGQVYYCGHSAEDRCGCRKPRPGLIVRAQMEHGFLPEETFLVGDSPADLAAADAAGCASILIRRGAFLETHSIHEESPLVACNLYQAAELILAAQDMCQRERALVRR
jgi:D-glycero-D-manno-heptose 1,7-bisphosphate phosphatase